MTQASRPQAEHITNYPAPSDPGPYSGDDWAEIFQIIFTSDQQTLQGPFVRYLNELEGADNGSNAVTVDTGAGIVNGHILISSEQETFAIPAGPVATRIDRVVMVENNTNTEVTQTTGGRPLLFPNDLSEYTATPGVPAYSARLAIVRGADGAGLPAIDQTTALYMVELYRYTINNVPTISSATDYREFAYFASTVGTRRFFVPAHTGYDVTGGTQTERNAEIGVIMVDAADCTATSNFIVPDDFLRTMTVQSVYVPTTASANIFIYTQCSYGQCAELYTTHTQSSGAAAVAVTQNQWNCVASVTLTNAAAGDIVWVDGTREATNVLDTLNAACRLSGWLVTYEATS